MDKLKTIYACGKIKLYEFNPSIFQLFLNDMEPLTIFRRCRFTLELIYGYRVYYLEIDGEIVGYCTVSSGRNPRYWFADNDDIIFGPYFVKETKRGLGYSNIMLDVILHRIKLDYHNAFDYINNDNIASIMVTKKVGGKRIFNVDINEYTRKMTKSDSGQYGIYLVSKEE